MPAMQAAKAALIALAALPALAGAATVEFAADLGVARTDNIARVATGEQSDTIFTVGTEFSVLHETRRMDADITGRLEWLDYANDTYSSELVGNVAASVRIGIVDDRFTWTLEDTFGQTRRDVFSVETPLNRENVNYASTGPNLRLPLGDAFELNASARYALVDYEDSAFDSERTSGVLSLARLLSASSSVGVNVGTERVEPRGGALFGAYDRSEASLRYSTRGSRTSFMLEAGGSQIDQGASSDSGLLARLEFSRRVGNLSTLSGRIGREYTDAANSLRQTGDGQLPQASLGTQSLTQTAEPFINEYAEADWRIAGLRTAIVLGVNWADEDYTAPASLDRRRTGVDVTVTRDIATRLRASASGRHMKYDVRGAAGDNSEKSLDLGLDWQVGRLLSLNTTVSHFRYTSDVSIGTVKEMRYWLRLRYGARISRAGGAATN
jgi:hypothetical protein